LANKSISDTGGDDVKLVGNNVPFSVHNAFPLLWPLAPVERANILKPIN
jgi:hypothetical protein